MAKKSKKNKNNATVLLLLGAAIGGFALFSSSGKEEEVEEGNGSGSGTGSGSGSGLPRGLSNNNPLNIVISELAWLGKINLKDNTDGRFEQFMAPEYGYRAAVKNMRYYYDNEGRTNLKNIIERWNGLGLPSSNYIKYVSDKTGIGQTAKIPRDFLYNAEKLWPIIRSMAEWENDPKYSNLVKYSDYYKGFKLT